MIELQAYSTTRGGMAQRKNYTDGASSIINGGTGSATCAGDIPIFEKEQSGGERMVPTWL